MSKRMELNSTDQPALENLHVVFEVFKHRNILIQEIYIYCDMMSDWIDITELMLSNKKFMEKLTDILDDHLINLEFERLASF